MYLKIGKGSRKYLVELVQQATDVVLLERVIMNLGK